MRFAVRAIDLTPSSRHARIGERGAAPGGAEWRRVQAQSWRHESDLCPCTLHFARGATRLGRAHGAALKGQTQHILWVLVDEDREVGGGW